MMSSRTARCVADHGHVHLHIFGNAGGVDIDVDDLGLEAKNLRLPVTRSSKRAPTAIKQSDSCTA